MIGASAALIEAACAGDERALSQLLRACQPDLRRFARRTCSNSEDAEDAVQVALWQLHRKIGTLGTVAAFASWLFRIVERECYRIFKRGAAKAPLPAPLAEELAAPPIPTDLRLDLAKAIAALPEAYRVALILRDVEELTAPEVAASLGLSVQAVKSRLHRARAMVRENLMNGGYWERDGESRPGPRADIG
ncbi:MULTISPECIES: RNA polymerase sigma factor [Variovorax]|jgi:RNA polymerase sigma factor (sigma-70 family)|uniref:RNA polymerase sigma factor n=1 Tax=Variovorax TaxID=34072 RepID=UPI0007813228|nr:RNA polymerase sigma factor [Variovorax paradoxus]MBW8717061.1 RNA polymerase sigma factor [Variovorax paradoxus]MBW8891829.1 RNA polymerase sigma factor [Burkholderiales bacterium]